VTVEAAAALRSRFSCRLDKKDFSKIWISRDDLKPLDLANPLPGPRTTCGNPRSNHPIRGDRASGSDQP
jgi:hypothetical protein